MTVRLYLAAVQLLPGPLEPGDLPLERLFIDASEFHEVWIETEMQELPVAGRSVAFSLPRSLGLGFERVIGTVERRINKHSKERE